MLQMVSANQTPPANPSTVPPKRATNQIGCEPATCDGAYNPGATRSQTTGWAQITARSSGIVRTTLASIRLVTDRALDACRKTVCSLVMSSAATR